MSTPWPTQVGRERFGKASAFISAGLSALAVWSWGAGVDHLLPVTAGGIPIAPGTAICLLLLSGFVGLGARSSAPPLVVQSALGLVASAGTLASVRPWFGWSSPLEEWLVQSLDRIGSIPVGQMSPLTGGMLFVVALAWWLGAFASRQTPLRSRMQRILALAVIVMAAGVTGSYAMGRPWFYGRSFIPMALWTALSFVFLGGAVLANASLSEFQATAAPAPVRPGQSARNLSVLSALTFVVAISIFTAVYLRNEQSQLREDARQLLGAIGDLKEKQVRTWREERLNDAQFLAQAEFVYRDVSIFLETPTSQEAKEKLLHWLQPLAGGARYSLAALFDATGGLRLATADSTQSKLAVAPGLLADALRSPGTIMADLQRSVDGKEVHLDIVFPVAAPLAHSPPLAVILLRMDPHEVLYPLLQFWPTHSRTGETLLIRQEANEVLYLSELRHRPNSALSVRMPLAERSTLPAARALLGQVGQIEGRDYRGVAVLADIRAVPNSAWFLITKLDCAEVYAPLGRQAWITISLTVVLAAAAGLMVGFVVKRREVKQALREVQLQGQQLAMAERVGHLMQNANDAILLADAQDNILEANDRAHQLYGYSLLELQSLKLPGLRAPATRPDYARDAAQLLAASDAVFQTFHQRKNGSIFPVEASCSIVLIDGVRYKLAFLRDISQRHAHEREIERLNRFYATLSQVNQCIVRVGSREELFRDVCRIAVENSGFSLAWIGWHNRQTQAVELMASAGDCQGYLANIKVSTDDSPEARGPTGRCIREGKACLCNDFLNDPSTAAWHAMAAAHHLRAAASLPIHYEGEVHGAFTVYADEPGLFQDKEMALLEEMAMDISYALMRFKADQRRLQVEAALHESEIKLRTLMANIPEKIFVKDRDSRFQYINQNFARDLGIRPEEVVGKLDDEFFPQELADKYRCDDQRVLATGQTEELEEKYVRNGNEIWVHTVKTPLRQADGTIAGVCGIFRDITQRKWAEAALRANEEQFRAMFELASVGMAQADLGTGRFLRVNEKLCEITGYSRDELHRLRFSEITHPEDRQEDLAAFQRVVRGESPEYHLEKRYLRKNGATIWVNVNVTIVRDGLGCPIHSMAMIEDITERGQKAEELRWKTAFLETLVHSSLDGILVVDNEGRKTFQNERLAELWQLPPEIVCNPDDQVLHLFAMEQTKDPVEFAQKRQRIEAHPDDIVHDSVELKNGKVLDRQTYLIKDRAGKSYGRVWTFRDITKGRQLEAQLRQSQKMEAVGTLAGGIAHDFNNMLGVIFGYASLLQQDTTGIPSAQEGLAEILKAGNRAKDLVQQILTFSRQNEHKRQVIHMGTVILEVIKFLRASMPAGISIDVHIDPAAPTVLADPNQIHQILMNLATNSLHAIGGKSGTLTVNLDRFQADAAFSRGHAGVCEGAYARLTVSDTGCGMDTATLERMFEPFFTTKAVGQGTGLGLAVVHGIVQAHNGILEVKSQPGVGTTFCLYLPAQTDAEISPLEASFNLPSGRGQRILVVDDEAALGNAFAKMLVRLNYQARTQTNPRQAVEQFRHSPEAFDLVLTDLSMPESTGLEMARELRDIRPDLPIILMSGFGANVSEGHLQEAGIIELLEKPVSAAALALVVHRVLAKQLSVEETLL